MEMVINRETLWHDGPKQIIVPEGETVWRELLHNVPQAEAKWMKQSIDHKKKFFGLKFVPIRIRGWWAIIDSDWLTAPKSIPDTTQETTRPRRELAGAGTR